MAGVTKYKIVLVRHGESKWNEENRFTGWTDVELSAKGEQEVPPPHHRPLTQLGQACGRSAEGGWVCV